MHYDEIARAAALLREAHHAVALTGAGVSTPSGIPDFRSPQSGLWEQTNPLEVASLAAFQRRPEAFYTWVRPLVEALLAARPNPAHTALAALEAGGWLKAVITQNIDGLHQQAGSHEVLELHGHLREATCLRCHRVLATDSLLGDFLASGEVPCCAECGGVIKPNVVLFREQLPVAALDAAMEHARRADLMLVAGLAVGGGPGLHLALGGFKKRGGLCWVDFFPAPL